jgi:hypothetical protein
VTATDLRDAWADLLQRRPAFRPTLAVYGTILEAWAGADLDDVRPLGWTAEECRAGWERGVPLAVEAPPVLPVSSVETVLAPVMEFLASLGTATAQSVQRFADAWDAGDLAPADLLPRADRIAAPRVGELTGLSEAAVAFLAYGGLRPALEAYFTRCREHLSDDVWRLGVCPFCGGPPGFGDLVEDGRRRLACHLCAGAWMFARVRCPFCGTEATRDLARLDPGEKEEGYTIATCKACRAYLKELDRRVRWNAGPPLVEDWASPHFDLVADREGYWRPTPSLLQLSRPR